MAVARCAGARVPRSAMMCGVMLVIAGCDGGAFTSGSMSVRDSAGVAIVELRSTDEAGLAWPVDAMPASDIGRAEGADVFGVLRRVIVLRAGGLAVADASAREIRMFAE